MNRPVWPSPAEVVRAGRFLADLPGFLRAPLSAEAARNALRVRFEAREEAFLALARRGIYTVEPSPYRRLLALAGCEFGDLEALILREGLEHGLRTLARRGVYLTVDEFKGRRAVSRGSASFDVDPAGLANPRAASHLVFRSSGSRGAGTVVSVDLALYRERAVNTGLCLEARGGWGWQHAIWVVPGGAAMLVLLQYAALGRPPVAWFSQVDPASPELDPRYAWSARAVRWVGRAVGTNFPSPVLSPLSRPDAVLEWLSTRLARGLVPHLLTFPSSAAELCRAANQAGVDLDRTQLSIGGEPITDARLAAIRAVGAQAVPHYGCMEAGIMSDGCLAPAAADDVHWFHDLNAVVQPGADLAGPLPPCALLVSSLRPTAPLILFNVSLGDQALLSRRRCGCPLESLGWTTHLQEIRSFEKLTAGGMTFLDADAISALEQLLPSRFGGSAGDYQLVEQEAADGRPRLVLIVSPRVGEVDAAAVGSTLLAALGSDSAASRVGELLWREGGLLEVERREPLAVGSGKILHLHSNERPAEQRASSESSR